jgi:hypothetical protein
MKEPITLGDVKRSGQDGYELKTGYLLLLKHGLMGTFPALISEDNELFICTDIEVLKKVWELLPKREAEVRELNLYANLSEKIGFNVEIGDHAESIRILTEEDFQAISVRDKPFKWQSGLLSLKDESNVASPFT